MGKIRNPKYDWQSAHKKNSITKIIKHAFSNCVNMLNDLNGIDTEDESSGQMG